MKNINLLACIILLCSVRLLSQDNANEVFLVVEEKPYLRSCQPNPDFSSCTQSTIQAYLKKHYKYPNAAYAKGIKGQLVAGFIVELDGGISSIKLNRDLGEGTGAELIRVLNQMQREKIEWVPARNGKKKVRCIYRVSFRIKPPIQLTATATAIPMDHSMVKLAFYNPQKVDKFIGELCPNKMDGHHISGDAEFGGPVYAQGQVNLKISDDRESILAYIGLNMREPQGDTKVWAEWTKTVYTAPSNKKIKHLIDYSSVDHKPTTVQEIPCLLDYLVHYGGTGKIDDFNEGERIENLPGAGFELGGCNEGKTYTLISTIHTTDGIPYSVYEDNPKSVNVTMQVIGDTGGNDVSHDRNCKCDSKIVGINIKNLQFELEGI